MTFTIEKLEKVICVDCEHQSKFGDIKICIITDEEIDLHKRRVCNNYGNKVWKRK